MMIRITSNWTGMCYIIFPSIMNNFCLLKYEFCESSLLSLIQNVTESIYILKRNVIGKQFQSSTEITPSICHFHI